jgi:hypothetical protein
MGLCLDKMYGESIDGLDDSIRKKVHVLFMVWRNIFHTLVHVHSPYFLMDKAFCCMDHNSTTKLSGTDPSQKSGQWDHTSLSTVCRGLNRSG